MDNKVIKYIYQTSEWQCPKCGEGNENEGQEMNSACYYCGFEVEVIEERMVN